MLMENNIIHVKKLQKCKCNNKSTNLARIFLPSQSSGKFLMLDNESWAFSGNQMLDFHCSCYMQRCRKLECRRRVRLLQMFLCLPKKIVFFKTKKKFEQLRVKVASLISITLGRHDSDNKTE